MTRKELDYAQRTPLLRRRLSVRSWIGLAIVASVLLNSIFLPMIWRNARMIYWQRQCMTYQPPAGQVVYDSQSKTSVVPEAWGKFCRLIHSNGPLSNGTVFLHELKNPQGQSRLVVMDLVPIRFNASGFDVTASVYSVGTLSHRAVELGPLRLTTGRRLIGGDSTRMQAFAGSADPTDPTHFSIRFTEDGKDQMYDGWLTQDDSIDFEPRPAGVR